MQSTLPIHFAPLQGYTEAIYRQAHARIFGGIESYYTPFVRVEHGEIRKKDMREIALENNRGVQLIPQLIAPDVDKMEQIIALFIEKGYKNVDINLGCPFPLLAKRQNASLSRRGAGVADCYHKESPRPSVLCQDEVGLGECGRMSGFATLAE